VHCYVPNSFFLFIDSHDSCWYKRSELGMRAALFFSAAALAGSFGGLLAAAITEMDGVGGYEGWRWICMSLQPIFSPESADMRQLLSRVSSPYSSVSSVGGW
jgi:hypothetical protein